MITACSHIAKMLGFYNQEEKSLVQSAEGKAVRSRFECMSDAELAELVAQGH